MHISGRPVFDWEDSKQDSMSLLKLSPVFYNVTESWWSGDGSSSKHLASFKFQRSFRLITKIKTSAKTELIKLSL